MNPLVQGIPIERPANDAAPLHKVPTHLIATWPIGTFVENLVTRADGALLVAVHSTCQIEVITPAGARSVLATLPGPIAGPVLLGDALFVNVSAPGQPPGFIFQVYPDGRSESWVEIPDALFLNGATAFLDRSLLVGDAVRGCIYLVDTVARTQRVWFEDAALKKVTAEPWLPGVNGIKRHGRYIYFSNTDAACIGRIPFNEAGQPGAVEIVAERFTCDDFAFDVSGNLYATTHVHNTVTRLSPDGARAVLAGAEEGLAGSTAIAFGRSPADRRSLYVTTTGGILAPHQGRVREAKLLRLDVEAEGAR